MNRVVVTGIGMINALGNDAKSSFKAICEGKTGVKKITLFDPSEFPVQIAAEISDFNPESVVDPKDVKKLDRFIVLGHVAADEAMKDCGLSEFDPDEFGISSAAGIGSLPNIEKNSNICLERGPRRISPFFVPSALVNMLGGVISIKHNLKGPNLASVTACAAGTHAIIEAAKTIMIGEARAMLVVGAESTICPVGIGGFATMKALSTRNDDPEHASRPFDGGRDGFVMGEGAGALVFEDYESAKARGAKIYAEIVGFATNTDGTHITNPNPDTMQIVMENSIKSAGISADDIGYVNAHGTGTKNGDIAESIATQNAFKRQVPISTIKSYTGHTLGACGAIEAILSIEMMRNKWFAPTLNLNNIDPECGELDYIVGEGRNIDTEYVMSNNFAFGGINTSLIFKRV